jgi:hypothetical protein
VNDPAADRHPPFVIIGNARSARVELFQAALVGLRWPPARVAGYDELLDGRATLGAVVTPGAVVRIESPDRDFAVERGILALGADEPDEEGEFARLDRRVLAQLTDDGGAIRFPRQWFLGYRRLLRACYGLGAGW